MIINKVSKEEFFASTFIAKQTSVVCMHPIKVSFKNNVFRDDIEQDSKTTVKFFYTVKGTKIPEPGLLDVKIDFKLIIDVEEGSKAKQDDPPIANLEILYLIRYLTPKGQIPTDIKKKCLPAFSKISAVIQCWPYLRQLVNQLTSEIGCAYLLPVLVFETEDDEKPDPSESTQNSEELK